MKLEVLYLVLRMIEKLIELLLTICEEILRNKE